LRRARQEIAANKRSKLSGFQKIDVVSLRLVDRISSEDIARAVGVSRRTVDRTVSLYKANPTLFMRDRIPENKAAAFTGNCLDQISNVYDCSKDKDLLHWNKFFTVCADSSPQ
jgi:hypothetical protein